VSSTAMRRATARTSGDVLSSQTGLLVKKPPCRMR
jgi:hypothetical protein